MACVATMRNKAASKRHWWRELMNDELHKLEERIAWLERKTTHLLVFAIAVVMFPASGWLEQALVNNGVQEPTLGIVLVSFVSVFVVVAGRLIFKGAPDQSKVKDLVGRW